jgi:Asp/Glu/hydantoin racemase
MRFLLFFHNKEAVAGLFIVNSEIAAMWNLLRSRDLRKGENVVGPMKVGLIRVITIQETGALQAHARILQENFPQLIIDSRCIENQPEGIFDSRTEEMAVPKIIKIAEAFRAEHADVIFISCAADPAMEECRKRLDIPVIGAGFACASIAYNIGRRIGVLGITETIPENMSKILNQKLVCYSKPEGIGKTTDLSQEESRTSIFGTADFLKKKGCDTIALACTGMATIGIYKEIRDKLGVQVVDPVIASGIVISYLNILKNSE